MGDGEAMRCVHCDELILPVEETEPGANVHRECGLRMIAGSVAHQQRRCSCFVQGSEEGDPPGVSKRDAARQAMALFEKLGWPG